MMNERTKTGLEVLQAAVLLGILGDVLLRETPWGLNVLLFIGALTSAMLMLLIRRKQDFLTKTPILLNGALIFFAAMFVWHDSTELKISDTLAIFTILAILILPALKVPIQIAGIFHYFIGFIWSGINAAFAPFLLIFKDVEWKTIPQTGWSKHLISILRGLAIAAPLLLIFGALFVAADAVFQGIVEQTLNVSPNVLVSHIVLTGFFSWIIAGYLRGLLMESVAAASKTDLSIKITDEIRSQTPSVTEEIREKRTTEKPEQTEPKTWQNFDNSVLPNFFTLGAIEISIVLGLINLLFLGFVVVQLPYLFGGMSFVQNTPDFKLAEYARRGFGELVAVAALVLPILLVSHWLLRKDNLLTAKIYRALAVIQIALLFVIMLSAAQRLFLLTGNLGYGLTTIRFYPMVVMIWLALIFVWFALTVLRGAREQFAWGALWLALFVLGTLHFFNPDEFIVRTNINLMREGRSFDARYAAQLSDDGVPTLLEAMPEMNFEQQCAVKNTLSRRLTKASSENDIRVWNWSRWKAQAKMADFAETLDTKNCPPTGQYFYEDFRE